ncbi:hypothetical protein [Pseudomonas syringae]|uniref:hypothetical protein n=1 Tax=Pseudomonas syringae TaxID=317 RepID=UPI000A230CE5|nr:hypothetical protein [Pseudomonas syringae]OSR64451.1 hypothetical protein BV327_05727 [Pseudomonas syringae pv. actinidiae]
MTVEPHGLCSARAFHRRVSQMYMSRTSIWRVALKWAIVFWTSTPCSLTDLNEHMGLAIEQWGQISSSITVVETFAFRDETVSRIQIWPFDPLSLAPEAMKIAVAASYTTLELAPGVRIVVASPVFPKKA